MNFRSMLSVFVVAISLGGVLGCNTVRGVGRDIERGGEITQDAAESVQRRF
jgi:predicted small secreted protein